MAKKSIGWTVVLLGGLAFLSAHLAGEAQHPTSRKRSTASKKAPARKAQPAKASTRKTKGSRRRTSGRYRYRLAQLRLRPERVVEIQRALIDAGYLKHEPTGKWDDATRDSMKRFQADNNFPTTGLPEAKSLMKLGLGPHALPEEIDPSAPARAGIDPPGPKSAPPSKPEGSPGPPK